MLIALICSLAAPSQTPSLPVPGRKLLWSEEFSAPGAPDPSRWTYELGKVRNNEAQTYTDSRSNSIVKDGHLVINALKDGTTITSASLTSIRNFRYGYLEVRAKVPTGRGTWPAIWLLADSIRQKGDKYIGWPECGEIDMMENVGFEPDKVHFNIHTGKYNHMIQTNKGIGIDAPGLHQAFHTYGLDWRKDRLDFYFDGKLVFTYPKESNDHSVWPYDDPHYLILNLAIGGSWGGQRGIDDAIFPSVFQVDYVRHYSAAK